MAHGKYGWLDETGKPIPEDWTRSNCCSQVDKMDEPEDAKIFDSVIVPDKFTTDHELLIGCKRLTFPVINLDADQQELFNAELLDGVLKIPSSED